MCKIQLRRSLYGCAPEPKIFLWRLVGTLAEARGEYATLRSLPSFGERKGAEDTEALVVWMTVRMMFSLETSPTSFVRILDRVTCRLHAAYLSSFCKFAVLAYRLICSCPRAQVRLSACCGR
jgi:hypothetical protein